MCAAAGGGAVSEQCDRHNGKDKDDAAAAISSRLSDHRWRLAFVDISSTGTA
jgi:hypothetical protein